MHCRVAEDKAAAQEQHFVETLDKSAVQRHLGGQHAHVLDAIARGAVASRPERVRGLRELDFTSTRLSCGGSIFPDWKSPMRVGGISTSLKFPSRMAGGLPRLVG